MSIARSGKFVLGKDEGRTPLSSMNGNTISNQFYSNNNNMKSKPPMKSSTYSSRTGWMEQKKGSGADNFYISQANPLSSIPNNGSDGQALFKKGKHRRFSEATTYFKAERGAVTDHTGLSHEEAVKHKESKSCGIVPILPPVKERLEDYGSYIKAVEGCGAPGLFSKDDAAIFNEVIPGGVLSKSPAKRTDWMVENKDAELLDAPGLEPNMGHADIPIHVVSNVEGATFGYGDRFDGFGSLYYNPPMSKEDESQLQQENIKPKRSIWED